jgi:monoamine oxidase
VAAGLLEKVVLVFKESFWDINFEWISVLNVEIPHFFNQKFKCKDNALMAFYSHNAREMTEKYSNEELTEISVKILEAKYGTVVREMLLESVVTRWNQDPFSNGK